MFSRNFVHFPQTRKEEMRKKKNKLKRWKKEERACCNIPFLSITYSFLSWTKNFFQIKKIWSKKSAEHRLLPLWLKSFKMSKNWFFLSIFPLQFEIFVNLTWRGYVSIGWRTSHLFDATPFTITALRVKALSIVN